jgi:small subunit ribosomal protein S17
MTRTVVVAVKRLVQHPLYKRFVKKTARFMAHDERGECRVGDTVEIVECRPMSARKRWRVARIVDRAVHVKEPVARAAADADSAP